ncbi:metal ABC transporter solute-binding protein, Zn/Mn family [Kocuria sp. M1R5S2]|uniref:metal ABC transporter solute-binding protein, Zn/Mn family n=1 Tax=Kocuria rhizosphaerae TaxID=3376285 RepID=UPI0037B70FDC
MTAPAPARPRTRARTPVTALAGAAVLGLAGCSGGGSGEEARAEDGLTVVTTTSVYADVVREVGGDAVTVDPVIDSTAQDPHSYEATAQDRLAVETADLVVLNGGGYDAFMEDLAAGGEAPVVEAYEVAGTDEEAAGEHADDGPADEGHTDEEHADEEHGAAGDDGHGHGEANEHVWYDLDAMDDVAGAIAERLAELDPDGADTYRENAGSFAEGLTALKGRLAQAPAGDTAFVATEPVAVYLLEDAGLHDDTPAEFTAAIENGTDVPPLIMERVREEFREGHVRLLAFNAQTASGQTEQLRDDAREAGAAVVEFTETLPEGTTYLEWMDRNVTDVIEALETVRTAPAGA